MRMKELRQKPDKELERLEDELVPELMKLRGQVIQGSIKKGMTGRIRSIKKDIARIKTLRRERK